MTILKRKPFRVLMAGLFCSAVFAALPMTVSADNANQAGDDITWAYDDVNDTLTFSGTGPMWDFDTTVHQRTYDGYLTQATAIVIGDKITHIGKEAFKDYGFVPSDPSFTITTVTMANTVTSIGDGAFGGCAKLKTANFSNSLESIGNSAFEYCFSQTGQNVELDLPNSVTTIGDEAFYLCAKLETVKFQAGLKTIGKNAFSSCISLETVDLSGTKLSKIGGDAFEHCKKLKTLILPATLTGIAAGTEDYDGDAFWDCDSLAEIYCYADPSNLTWNDKGCNDFAGAAYSYTTVCYVPADYLEAYETKFGSDSTNPVNVTFKSLIDMGVGLGEHLYGYTLSLDGDIGVNFYMELPDSLKNSDTAYMKFTVPNGSKTETQTLSVKTVTSDQDNVKNIGSKTYYKFKCKVSAKDMASEITAQMFEGSSEGKEYTYSVKDYADYLLAHTKVEQYAKAAPLVKAMLNYGAASQTYFGIEGTAANAELDDADKALGEVNIPDTFKYADNAKLPEGVTFEGSTLSLKSETTLSLYFKGLAEDTKFTCNGKTVKTAKNGDYVVARIRGINAKDIGKDFTVTFGNNNKVTYNPLTYCYNVLNGGSDKENLQNVCKALYIYYQAAHAYFG